MVGILSAKERHAVEEAIKMAEMQTAGEIRVSIARCSGDYQALTMLMAGTLAFALPPLLWHILPSLNVDALWIIQAVAFVLLVMAIELSGVYLWFTPASWKQRSAARHAREQFFTLGMHRTLHRAGVLIFISEAEHYAEIIADDGIAAKVPAEEWQSVIAPLIAALRKQTAAAGMIETIEKCAGILALHAPPQSPPRNELPNTVAHA